MLIYTAEVAEEVEQLVRQEPPEEQGRATWTLKGLAEVVATRFDTIKQISHETVRRMLSLRGILYYRAKEWLVSPDPLYELRKSQRDRLLTFARACPDGAAVWLDESWFVRWPYRFWTWASKDDRPRVAQRWNEEVDTTALFAALDDETQQTFLRWADGQPNSERMTQFLETLMDYWTQRGKRFIVLFWDKASFHTSKQTTNWIREYNRRAKRENLTRLIVCKLPTRSPWLMPLEPIFGWTKHQVLGNRAFETVAEMQKVVENHFRQRVAEAQKRRDQAWAKALAAAA